MPPKGNSAPVPAARFGRVKSNLKMGVVGLPNVGKSSLFNLLTSQSAAVENYPFCTIEPNEARCPVPDERYEFLCSLWKPPSTQPAYLHVTDIAGLIRGASEGAGLGNAFLSHIQAVDGIFHVVRVFEDNDIVHVDDSVDPIRDLETIQSELCKKDLDIVRKAYAAEELAVKKTGGKFKLSPLFISTMEKLQTMLEGNIPVRSGEWTTSEIELINEKMSLITTKPVIYLANMSKADYIRKKNKWLPKIHAWIQSHGGGNLIPFSVEFERELWDLHEDQEAAQKFLAEAGVASALPKMIKTGYKELNLIYFFTAGDKEVRAWTVYSGAAAPEAASVIHTDFGKAFIKAEVVSFEDYKSLNEGQKGMAAVKAAGKYRIEGKTYIVQDGDIIYFQIGTLNPKKK
ncbi:Beta-grasp domain-containing protein [Rozella allomycis CSF55]|uniref:Obg-like ATPase 1 n=1 Tax=Rozella allomycis (strain CSF55) TaxID=988480 RepID=A0A075B3Y1_ROZAC|nr:Beta-grasp domain-containing protein [Rozella allomycis CSF55]|eukprot:EPZ35678.1 Beta-grasp domain-containing protein [Rozella allomycis CSF55]